MRNNKKGFTLVELLAVIVILAVVMLIGITSMGPIMANSRKSALKSDGIDLMNAAKTAYQAEAMTNNPAFQPNQSICFDITWLVAKGYAENKQSYNASVLVKYDSSTNQYSYTYWIANGNYAFKGADAKTAYDDDNKVKDYADSDDADLNSCGQASEGKTCTAVKGTDGKYTSSSCN